MLVKYAEIVWDDVGIWNEIEQLSPKLFLQFQEVYCHPIFPGDLVRLRKVVDFLVLIQTFVKIRLAGPTRPKDVPLVGLSVSEHVCFQDGPH